jgi:hypothetical protein
MTVAELIKALQKLDPEAKVVAPFSPNPMEINVEEVGGLIKRAEGPFSGAAELTRKNSSAISSPKSYQPPVRSHAGNEGDAVSEAQLLSIRQADTDAPV